MISSRAASILRSLADAVGALIQDDVELRKQVARVTSAQPDEVFRQGLGVDCRWIGGDQFKRLRAYSVPITFIRGNYSGRFTKLGSI